MSLSPRDTHIFQLLLVFILITIAFYYLFLENRYDVHDVYRATVTGKKQSFIEDFLSSDIDGSFDGSPLADLCNTRTWVPGLIFKCEPPRGGVSNVRNIMLNCVRYAIEAGATGFIVPEIMVHRPKLASVNDLHAQRVVPFTYLFDQAHFTTTLGAACPKMHIYDHQNDLWDMPSTAIPVHIPRAQLTSLYHTQAETVMLSPANWTTAFNDLLNTSYPRAFSTSKPVLVSLESPLLQWPLSYDQPAFVATFGRILRFNEDLRRLAATVVYAMSAKYQLGINPSLPGIQDGRFYGAHLRSAIDAVKASWTPYETQAKNYISHATDSNLRLMYAASDSPKDLVMFIDEAGNNSFPIEVTTKDLLLLEKGFKRDVVEMASLTLEQQSAIDYEVLLRASLIGGTRELGCGLVLKFKGDWPRYEGVE
ncbi:hypothetical protein D0Z07_2317 [Hyphodiscus hymeniophilus]|uniref:Uncharacterized protein n=1 Tax=Hyphodiscus hymeniophilus TaxID=353542 RepID=A0A9P6VMG3_9HELO|nr:hypothetical protein D0Z07_2317 [Hyphodiscus hymeniophilus]